MKTVSASSALEENLTEQQKKALSVEVGKIKYLQNLDEIIALSELNEEKTIQFIKQNKTSGVSFIVDSSDNTLFFPKQGTRFEMLLENGIVTEYRKDPSVAKLFMLYILLSVTIGVIGYSSQNLYLILFKESFSL
jgi:hypothetical protein